MIFSIKRKREGKELSQTQIAKEIGVTQGAIALWESGKAMPKADKLPKLAKVLECRVEDLFEIDEVK